jgi:type VI secretion system secreted protein Hcp
MRRVSRAVVLAAAMLAVTGAQALAAPAYLKIGDIKGESKDPAHKEWIDILSWDWALNVLPTVGGGGATGKVEATELVVEKRVDSASPQLMRLLAGGEPVDEVQLEIVLDKAGRSLLRVTLGDALVTGVAISREGGLGGSGERELVRIVFRRVRVEHVGPSGTVDFEYDFASAL